MNRWRSLTSGERARYRKLQLEGIEREQLLEDKEALKMTEEERETLLSSFQSVKTEFYDLDGLSWSESSFHNDDLAGLHHQGFSYCPRNSPAPTEITNSPIIGQHNLVQQSPTASKARISKDMSKVLAMSENRDVEANAHFGADLSSKYSQVEIKCSTMLRSANPDQDQDQDQNQILGSADDTASVASSCDDTIRASYYIPLATSPNATFSPPYSEYVPGTSAFRCSSSGSPETIAGIGASGLERPALPRFPRDVDTHFGPLFEITSPKAVGLGLPGFWDAAVKSTGFYPELSKSSDVDVTSSISNKQVSGLPSSPLSSPSSQDVNSSVLASPQGQKGASHTTLGLALTFPQVDTSQTADAAAVPQSPASRWLELYYGPRLYSAQALGINLPTIAKGDHASSERHGDSNLVHLLQAFETPSAVGGSISASLGWSARPRSFSSPRWSECPQSSPLLATPTFDTPHVQERSAPALPLQSFEEIRHSTSSYILESYSIAAYLPVEA